MAAALGNLCMTACLFCSSKDNWSCFFNVSYSFAADINQAIALYTTVQLAFCASSVAKERISSRTTSVAGLPVLEQYVSNFSTSPDVRLIVSRFTAHFLFIIEQPMFDILLYYQSSKLLSPR